MNVLTEGVNIILAVDLSESMAALDFKRKGKVVNRLEALKGVVEDFVRKRTGDRIGLVVFGSQAYTQIPLTRDYTTIVSIARGAFDRRGREKYRHRRRDRHLPQAHRGMSKARPTSSSCSPTARATPVN